MRVGASSAQLRHESLSIIIKSGSRSANLNSLGQFQAVCRAVYTRTAESCPDERIYDRLPDNRRFMVLCQVANTSTYGKYRLRSRGVVKSWKL